MTNFGDQKSRKWLRRAKRENPGAVTVLTGCYPQAFPDEAAEIAEADVVTGSGNRHAILTDVQKVLNGEEERVVDIRPHEKGERFEELPMDKFAEHTRAFVKVEDGCNRRCAYCVLTAISLPSYGTDSGTSLVELIEKAAEVPGIERIRLGSLDPDMLHDDDIRRMAAAVEEVRAAEAAAMQGRKASVLLETPLSATMFTGYTKQYLPVLVSAPGHKTGDVVEVTLGAWDGKRCRAEIV